MQLFVRIVIITHYQIVCEWQWHRGACEYHGCVFDRYVCIQTTSQNWWFVCNSNDELCVYYLLFTMVRCHTHTRKGTHPKFARPYNFVFCLVYFVCFRLQISGVTFCFVAGFPFVWFRGSLLHKHCCWMCLYARVQTFLGWFACVLWFVYSRDNIYSVTKVNSTTPMFTSHCLRTHKDYHKQPKVNFTVAICKYHRISIVCLFLLTIKPERYLLKLFTPLQF